MRVGVIRARMPIAVAIMAVWYLFLCMVLSGTLYAAVHFISKLF